MRFVSIVLSVFLLATNYCIGQEKDSVGNVIIAQKTDSAIVKADTSHKPVHSPKKAAIRSAILPGWGQAYNKKYWKIPIVYTAIGIPVGTYFYNKKWYEQTKEVAFMIATGDTANYKNRVDERFYVFFENPDYAGALTQYRNEYRRNMDYSILFVLLFWGLNVVDATVDAHLKGFDIGDQLSLKIKPTLFSGSSIAGVSFVFTIGRNGSKNITSLK